MEFEGGTPYGYTGKGLRAVSRFFSLAIGKGAALYRVVGFGGKPLDAGRVAAAEVRLPYCAR